MIGVYLASPRRGSLSIRLTLFAVGGIAAAGLMVTSATGLGGIIIAIPVAQLIVCVASMEDPAIFLTTRHAWRGADDSWQISEENKTMKKRLTLVMTLLVALVTGMAIGAAITWTLSPFGDAQVDIVEGYTTAVSEDGTAIGLSGDPGGQGYGGDIASQVPVARPGPGVA